MDSMDGDTYPVTYYRDKNNPTPAPARAIKILGFKVGGNNIIHVGFFLCNPTT